MTDEEPSCTFIFVFGLPDGRWRFQAHNDEAGDMYVDLTSNQLSSLAQFLQEVLTWKEVM